MNDGGWRENCGVKKLPQCNIGRTQSPSPPHQSQPRESCAKDPWGEFQIGENAISVIWLDDQQGNKSDENMKSSFTLLLWPCGGVPPSSIFPNCQRTPTPPSFLQPKWLKIVNNIKSFKLENINGYLTSFRQPWWKTIVWADLKFQINLISMKSKRSGYWQHHSCSLFPHCPKFIVIFAELWTKNKGNSCAFFNWNSKCLCRWKSERDSVWEYIKVLDRKMKAFQFPNNCSSPQ